MGCCFCIRVWFDIDSDEFICICFCVIFIWNCGGVKLVVFFVVYVFSWKFYIGVFILYYFFFVLVWDIVVLFWDIIVLWWDIIVCFWFVMDVGFVKWCVFVFGFIFIYNIIMIIFWFWFYLCRFFDFLMEFVNGFIKN